jgi:uncharacterized membrane protein
MNALLLYAVAVLLLAGFSVLVIISFWRYHFKGDKTTQIIALFLISFALVTIATLTLVDYRTLIGQGSDHTSEADSLFGF